MLIFHTKGLIFHIHIDYCIVFVYPLNRFPAAVKEVYYVKFNTREL